MRTPRSLIAAALVAAVAVTSSPVAAAPQAAAATAGSDARGTSPALDAARAKMAAGDTAGALADLEGYVPAHPADLAAARFLGDIYFRIPDYKRAEAVWRRIVAANSGDKETHNRLGSLYAALDRVPEAIAEFTKSLPFRSGFAGLVDLHRRAGDLAAFERIYRLAAEAAPIDAQAQENYGIVLHAEKRYLEALSYLDRAVHLRGNDCGMLVELANDKVDLGRVDAAIDDLGRCIAVNAKFYPALVNMGEAYLEKSQYDRARPWLDRALAAQPEGPEALVDLGYIDDVQGRWNDAVAKYRRAMASDPLQPEAYIDLGYDYNEHAMYALAEAIFLKGISVKPDEPRMYYLLAVTYNLQGKIALAREHYERAIAMASGDVEVVRAARAELALLPQHN